MVSPRLRFGLIAFLLILPAVGPTVGHAQEGPDVAEQVRGLVDRMEDSSETGLWQLSARVTSLGPKAAPVLLEMLPALKPRARLGAAGALFDLGEKSAGTTTLLGLAGAGSPVEVRIASIRLLGRKATDEIEQPILALLDDAFDSRVRIALARTLWDLTRDLRAKEELKAVLRSTDADVRIEGALALAEIGDVDSVKPILDAVRDEPTLRGRMAGALLDEALWRRRALSRPDGAAPDAGTPAPEAGAAKYTDALLKEIMAYIHEYYLDADKLTDGGLLEAAARGVMESLDIHSAYFNPKERFDWQEDLNPVYGGIGSYVNFVDEIFTIVRPMFGGPAYKAGLKAGDQLLKVDGWETTGRTTEEIIKRLRGEPGTDVLISIYRKGWQKIRDYTIQRARIHVPTVDSTMLPGAVGYARLSTFGRDSSAELKEALEKLEREGMKAFVLDLRFNGGGFLDTAQEICDLFLDRGKLIVYTEGRNPEAAPRRELRTTSRTTRPDYPVVILVNGASASASEIVSGCLQHYGRAELVGLRTYGKGSVQNVYNLFVSPPAEPWVDVNANGTYDFDEPYVDSNESGAWEPGERFFDRNNNGRWDAAEPYTDVNGNHHFDYPAVKITIAKYFLPSGVSLRREQKEVNGKLQWIGGVNPDVWVAPEEPDGWRNEELTRLEEKGVFDEYLAAHYTPETAALFDRLAFFDAGRFEEYPEFEKLFASLDTKLDRKDVWWWLRLKTRRKVGDERGREMVGDFEQDQQLQVAILRALDRAKVDAHSVPEYGQFADRKFPEVPEEQRSADETTPSGR